MQLSTQLAPQRWREPRCRQPTLDYLHLGAKLPLSRLNETCLEDVLVKQRGQTVQEPVDPTDGHSVTAKPGQLRSQEDQYGQGDSGINRCTECAHYAK
ncbi:MAG: hypothetical protein KDK05_00955 [Candidatus Competibacteraceae bacterium]|nr:hypothetical protein [Candidatus Competibacteraceae bacterium]MCB1803744.1 hypothetical protein [Candidatus Competibacteraceae bacterium]